MQQIREKVVISKEKAKAILDYLVSKKLGFCFLKTTGQIVSVEDCLEILEKFERLKAEEDC